MKRAQPGLMMLGGAIVLNLAGRAVSHSGITGTSVIAAAALLAVMLVSVALGILGIVRLVKGLATRP